MWQHRIDSRPRDARADNRVHGSALRRLQVHLRHIGVHKLRGRGLTLLEINEEAAERANITEVGMRQTSEEAKTPMRLSSSWF